MTKISKKQKSSIQDLRVGFEVQAHAERENFADKEIVEIKYKFKDGASRRVIINSDGTYTVINKGAKK